MTGPRAPVRAGSPAVLDVDIDRLHFFDPDTHLAIAGRSAESGARPDAAACSAPALVPRPLTSKRATTCRSVVSAVPRSSSQTRSVSAAAMIDWPSTGPAGDSRTEPDGTLGHHDGDRDVDFAPAPGIQAGPR